ARTAGPLASATTVAALVAVVAAQLALYRAGLADTRTLATFTVLAVFGGLVLGRREPSRPLGWAWAVLCVGAIVACLAWAAADGELVRGRDADLGLAASALAAMVLADTPRWSQPRRARSGLAFSLGQVALAFSTTGGTGETLVAPLAVWAVAAAVVLVAARQAPTPLSVQAPSAPAAAASAARARRDGLVVVGVALLLVLVMLPWLSRQGIGRLSPDRFDRFSGPGDRGGDGALLFDRQLDTANRNLPGDTIVLRVRADAPDFWRAQTYDEWDGRTWAASGESGPRPPATTGDRAPFVQEVRVEAWTDLVVAAYRPLRVRLPERVSARPGPDESIRAVPGLAPGDRYVVESDRPTVTDDLLRSHDPSAPGAGGADGRLAPFLQLPGDVPDRVVALAEEVAGRAPTAYDAIVALEGWLGENTTYTLDIPPLPEGADGVEQFLFVDRRGFCNQIAASLAVMARSLGIPARVATGYVPGERDRVTGEWVVRASDAHAWVEVWFPGLGWQGFDPTAEVPLSGEDSAGPLDWRLVVLGAAALVLLVGAAALVLGRRRAQRQLPWPRAMAERLGAEGARRGRPRGPDETLREYAGALVAGPLPDERLHDVVAIADAAAFSGRPPPPDVVARAEALLGAVLADNPGHEHPPARPWALAGRGRRGTST
ncbi:MAG: DUF4129 domain-containing protein, partial [Acidimicrobiia bacterium]|nr:DUF4129 domain-containing protein [Acidimicrobiia bacterium]